MSERQMHYDPSCFDVNDLDEARRIILTEDSGRSPEQRWAQETPYLVELMGCLRLTKHSVVLDYGCGVGRLSKALIDRYGCRVVGTDISASMRALAAAYVNSPNFFCLHPTMLGALKPCFDTAIAVWVLQHCPDPKDDIENMHISVRAGGTLFVVNQKQRVIPCNVGWVDDRLDLDACVEYRFRKDIFGPLDADLVGSRLAERSLWALYSRKS